MFFSNVQEKHFQTIFKLCGKKTFYHEVFFVIDIDKL